MYESSKEQLVQPSGLAADRVLLLFLDLPESPIPVIKEYSLNHNTKPI